MEPKSDPSDADRYERQLRINDGQIEITLPAALADRDGLDNGDRFKFTPRLDKQSIVLEVSSTDDEGRNVRRLRRAGEWDQAYLRFPTEMAYAMGWQDFLDAPDVSPTVAIERRGRGEYAIRTWPSTKPWYSERTDMVAQESFKRLVENDSGPGADFIQYRLEIPSAIVEAYGLGPETKLATRLTARDGELALAYDRDVGAHEAAGPHVRTVFRSGGTPDGEGGYERQQFGVNVPKALARSLGLVDSVELRPEEGQLVLCRP
jgi:bifunctional DNA-binding transcriptional regulator/antitoxin component of YhaV-PrlF toxin-antitoxin module